MIFAPDNDLTKKYVALVDDVSKIVIESDIELKVPESAFKLKSLKCSATLRSVIRIADVSNGRRWCKLDRNYICFG